MAQMEPEIELNPINDLDAPRSILVGVVRCLVNHPDQVRVDAASDTEGLLLTVRVSEDDLDRVIGASGRTARSLRAVLSALGKRTGQRFTLEILATA